MSAHVDQFCDTLRDRLNAIEEQIKSAKSRIVALTEQGEAALREELDSISTDLQTRKQDFEQTVANMRARAQQKLAETTERVSEWKAKREIHKLKGRADRAEAYAADAITFAVCAIDEAERASLEAALARIEVDAAQ